MTDVVTLGNTVEAFGHPTNCTEPATGSVSQKGSETNGVTITNASGTTSRLASVADAELVVSSHAHDYSSTEGCHDTASHALSPDSSEVSSSLSIDGSPVMLAGAAVTTDPKSGGDVKIATGSNNSITQ